MQEPAVYRLQEAIMHNGEAIKALINEEFGDGKCVCLVRCSLFPEGRAVLGMRCRLQQSANRPHPRETLPLDRRVAKQWLTNTLLRAPAGIMSAIDFYCTVDRMEGTQGERRVVITFNGACSALG